MNDNNFVVGSYYQNNYSKEQNQQFAVEFEAITNLMVEAMDQGHSYSSEQMQLAVQKHFDFCSKFWSPNRESYRALALSFVLPSGYHETYESYREGLGKYIYDAACHFADTRLS